MGQAGGGMGQAGGGMGQAGGGMGQAGGGTGYEWDADSGAEARGGVFHTPKQRA